MKQLLTTLLLFWSINIFAQQTYDIVIVGGTPGGLTTALAAAKLGKTSVMPKMHTRLENAYWEMILLVASL